MEIFLQILPNELLVELSLYLTHQETYVLLDVFPYLYTRCWLNKIEKELNFSPEFIKKYIYRNGSNMTLLPLDEKYLELMSRSRVDIGVEKYIIAQVYVHRASRHPDPQYARTLLLHMFSQLATEELYSMAIEGLMSMTTKSRDFYPYLRLLKEIIYRWNPTSAWC